MVLIHTQYKPEEDSVIAKGLHMIGQISFIIHYVRTIRTSKFLWKWLYFGKNQRYNYNSKSQSIKPKRKQTSR